MVWWISDGERLTKYELFERTPGTRLVFISGVLVDTKNSLQKAYRDVLEQHIICRAYSPKGWCFKPITTKFWQFMLYIPLIHCSALAYVQNEIKCYEGWNTVKPEKLALLEEWIFLYSGALVDWEKPNSRAPDPPKLCKPISHFKIVICLSLKSTLLLVFKTGYMNN